MGSLGRVVAPLAGERILDVSSQPLKEAPACGGCLGGDITAEAKQDGGLVFAGLLSLGLALSKIGSG